MLLDQAVTEPFVPVLATGAELLPFLGDHDHRGGQQQILAVPGQDTAWYVECLGPLLIVGTSDPIRVARRTSA